MSNNSVAAKFLLDAGDDTDERLVQRLLLDRYRRLLLEAFMSEEMEGFHQAKDQLRKLIGPRPNRHKGFPQYAARKFTPEQVREMRAMRQQGLSLREIARRFGNENSRGNISALIERKTYKDIV